MSPKKVLPKMEGFVPSSPLVEEALLSFDQMRRQLKATEKEMKAFVGDRQIEED